jgi:hypothetical protein
MSSWRRFSQGIRYEAHDWHGRTHRQQVPRSPRRNGLAVKLVDGAFLMRQEHLAGAF